MRQRVLLSILFLVAVAITSQAQQNTLCFTPLANTQNAQDNMQWSTIYNRSLPSSSILADSTGFKKYQDLKTDANGPINLDYYGLSFRADPNNTSENVVDIYNKLRKAFYFFAVTPTSDAPLGFFPYQNAAITNPMGDSLVGKHNRERWESNNPVGAMMTFIVSNQPYTGVASAPIVTLAFKTISVVVVCASKQDFIFATVTSDGDGTHPVSGYRGFGLRQNTDNSLTLYTMGTDRAAYITYPGVPGLHSFPGNFALIHGAMAPKIPATDDAPFVAGDQFWLEFFANAQSYLNNHNYQTTPYVLDRLSNRYTYPFPPGPPPGPIPQPPLP